MMDLEIYSPYGWYAFVGEDQKIVLTVTILKARKFLKFSENKMVFKDKFHSSLFFKLKF